MEWPKMSSGGRPGRRKAELRSAALCATCCSSVYSCANPNKESLAVAGPKKNAESTCFPVASHLLLAASLRSYKKTTEGLLHRYQPHLGRLARAALARVPNIAARVHIRALRQ